ncbi:hypothetical protein [Mannheimia indoligenes]|uniref:hypothetical protein n=1 Tax=Mannheimia indoligenes TaxID=3103145 RepID=UPI002FE698A2
MPTKFMVYHSKCFQKAANMAAPDIKAHYDRLIAKGKTKMQTVGAAMRYLVHISWGVKNQSVY